MPTSIPTLVAWHDSPATHNIAGTAEAIHLHFTPVSAAVGGLILGAATLGRFALTGRILGISGILRGGLSGDFSSWRVSFISGLASAGIMAARVVPHAFEALPSTFSVRVEILHLYLSAACPYC